MDKLYYRKNRGFFCLFLVVCLWMMPAQAGDDRSMIPADATRRDTGVFFCTTKVLSPCALLPRITKVFAKAADNTRPGSYIRQSPKELFSCNAFSFLHSALWYCHVCMSQNRHLTIFYTLIHYIQNQDGF